MSLITLISTLWALLPDRETWRQKMDEGTSMFGKPEWFVKKTVGWGIHPVTWQGWLYAVSWGGVITAPFVTLIARHQFVESGIWAIGTVGLLLWDVKKVLGQMDKPATEAGSDDIMYVVDRDDPSRLETEKFKMRLS